MKTKAIIAFVLFVAVAIGVAVILAISAKKDFSSSHSRSFYDFSSEIGNIEPVGSSPPIDAGLLIHGEWVYRGMCIGCHGVKGDGNGGVWTLGEKYSKAHQLPRMPRDFSAAIFKIGSTPSGSLPTDNDLFNPEKIE